MNAHTVMKGFKNLVFGELEHPEAEGFSVSVKTNILLDLESEASLFVAKRLARGTVHVQAGDIIRSREELLRE